MTQPNSPKITQAEWGQIYVDGYEAPFRDAKLYPGGAREWDWRETGTHHVPGIQPADVEELLAYNPSLMVLSKGFWQRLQVQQETRTLIENKGIELFILETGQAVEKYNNSAQELPVAGLFHSTC